MSLLLCRYRKFKNGYSWGPLVPALQKAAGRKVMLLRKDVEAEARKALEQDDCKSKIFYFDSFMSVDTDEANKDLRTFLSTLSPERLRRTVTVAGGAHPTSDPLNTLSLGFDIVLRGEGELSIQRTYEVVAANKNWREIPGATFRKPREGDHASPERCAEASTLLPSDVVFTPAPPNIDLDDYPPFCEDPPIHPPIELVRYCQTTSLHGGKVRFRSLKSFEAIVKSYAEHFPPPVDIRVISPNILAYQTQDPTKPNIPALMKLVEIVQRYNGKIYMGSFPSEVRPESVTPEAVLAYSHTNVVSVGGQSGSNAMLQKMHRGHTADQILHACKLLKDGGLVPLVDFILGCPTETEAEQLESLAFMNKLVDNEYHIRLHYFMPLPGTPWGKAQPSPLSPKVLSLAGALLRRHPYVDGPFGRQMEDSLSIARRVQKQEAVLKSGGDEAQRQQRDAATVPVMSLGEVDECGITQRFDVEELAKFVAGLHESERAAEQQRLEKKQRQARIRAEKFSKRRANGTDGTSQPKKQKTAEDAPAQAQQAESAERGNTDGKQ